MTDQVNPDPPLPEWFIVGMGWILHPIQMIQLVFQRLGELLGALLGVNDPD